MTYSLIYGGGSMTIKRIIFEQIDKEEEVSNMEKQMKLRRDLVYRHVKSGGQGFLNAASFIAPILIVGTLVFLYLLLR